MRIEQKTPFVGRRVELEKLGRKMTEAARNNGSVVLIGGEPGVGKSRLAHEDGAQAERLGLRCLLGRCYETDVQVPFAPLVDLAARAARSEQAGSFRRALGQEASGVARILPQLRTQFPDLPPALQPPSGQER